MPNMNWIHKAITPTLALRVYHFHMGYWTINHEYNIIQQTSLGLRQQYLYISVAVFFRSAF